MPQSYKTPQPLMPLYLTPHCLEDGMVADSILLCTQGSRNPGKANDMFKVTCGTEVSSGRPGLLLLTQRSLILEGASDRQDAGLDG